jgi:plasmid maintenance system antidote protein VapI
LGGIPKQHISNMENGKRPISLKMAKKLSKLFNVSIERFIS